MKTWKDLTEQERQQFTDEFYACWHEKFDFADDTDQNNPAPWGCPWDYVPNEKTVSAEDYFASVRDEIEELAKREKE